MQLLALRDDSDIDNNQVFIHQDGNFYKCECDSKIDMWGDFEESESYPRKGQYPSWLNFLINNSMESNVVTGGIFEYYKS